MKEKKDTENASPVHQLRSTKRTQHSGNGLVDVARRRAAAQCWSTQKLLRVYLHSNSSIYDREAHRRSSSVIRPRNTKRRGSIAQSKFNKATIDEAAEGVTIRPRSGPVRSGYRLAASPENKSTEFNEIDFPPALSTPKAPAESRAISKRNHTGSEPGQAEGLTCEIWANCDDAALDSSLDTCTPFSGRNRSTEMTSAPGDATKATTTSTRSAFSPAFWTTLPPILCQFSI
ncbi:hypothetical protein TgHK011_004803 [Trichoderma gracile]|nr:hypothetical protein TgHK011_004803 [Trichoderma gracile]